MSYILYLKKTTKRIERERDLSLTPHFDFNKMKKKITCQKYIYINI